MAEGQVSIAYLSLAFLVGSTGYDTSLSPTDEDVKDYCNIIAQVLSDVGMARTLFDRDSGSIGSTEYQWIEQSIGRAESALRTLEDLIDRVRRDMAIEYSSLEGRNRLIDAVTDSAKIKAAIERLDFADRPLHACINMICCSRAIPERAQRESPAIRAQPRSMVLSQHDWVPTCVIGIDFGTTFTAVAYALAPEWHEPRCLQRWPGAGMQPKVPSNVLYDREHRAMGWGFQCLQVDIPCVQEELFKPYLDPNHHHKDEWAPSHVQAVQFYKDYMRFLHKYLQGYFGRSVHDWHKARVEFNFCVPSTWKDPRMIDTLRSWLAEASFKDSEKQRVKIELTEAEAAASSASRQRLEADGAVIAIDAGASKTEISVFRRDEGTLGSTPLHSLSNPQCIEAGSIRIDQHVHRYLSHHLRACGCKLGPEELKWQVMSLMEINHFEAAKIEFDGSPAARDFALDIPADLVSMLGTDRIIVPRGILQEAFDQQIHSLFDKLSVEMRLQKRDNPSFPVRYIVLSGGFGSSRYLQSQLMSRYLDISIKLSPNCMTAVAEGLVMNSIRRITSDGAACQAIRARVSYGILVRLPYDATIHAGAKVSMDPIDRRKWAEEQIDWLIKEGELVHPSGILKDYKMKVNKNDTATKFVTQFVMSEFGGYRLPKDMRNPDVSRLCTVTAQLTQNFQNTLKKPGFFSRNREYYLVEFRLKVILESSRLRFEIVSMDGKVWDENDARIEVAWETHSPSIDMSDRPWRIIYPSRPR